MHKGIVKLINPQRPCMQGKRHLALLYYIIMHDPKSNTERFMQYINYVYSIGMPLQLDLTAHNVSMHSIIFEMNRNNLHKLMVVPCVSKNKRMQ